MARDKQVLIVAELPESDRGKVLRDKLRGDWIERAKVSAAKIPMAKISTAEAATAKIPT